MLNNFFSLIFWLFLYNYEDHGHTRVYLNLFEHLFNFLIVLMDLFISGRLIRKIHFYIPFTFGILYLIFATIYELTGGLNIKGEPFIYKILRWRSDKVWITVVIVVGVSFAIPIIHFLIWSLTKFRIYIHDKYFTDGKPPIHASREDSSPMRSLNKTNGN